MSKNIFNHLSCLPIASYRRKPTCAASSATRANSGVNRPGSLQGGAEPDNPGNRKPSNRLHGDSGEAGRIGGPGSGPSGGGGGRRSGGYPRLLNANSQGVAPQQRDTPPSTASSAQDTRSARGVFSGFSADNDNGGGAVNTRYDSGHSYPSPDASGVINHGSSGTHGGQQV